MSDGARPFVVVADGISIPAGQSIELTPDGVQIYFPGLTQALVAGRSVAGTLDFARAGSKAIEFMIEPASLDENSASGGHGAMSGHHHRH
jgi:copper(I)-binding protein